MDSEGSMIKYMCSQDQFLLPLGIENNTEQNIELQEAPYRCSTCNRWLTKDDLESLCLNCLKQLSKNGMVGEGGAPTRATTLPSEATLRKNYPIATGVLDYFPDAIVAISQVSKAGNDQHNPGLPLRWTRSKSGDEGDTCMRHFLQRGTIDIDGMRHTAKAAWRILALLQKEIENDQSSGKK